MSYPPASARASAVEPFFVMQILARARELEAAGRDIVHMEIGEPDFVTPEPVLRAARAAIDAGKTHYTPATGLPELREAIAGYYATRFGVQVAPGQVVVTPGSSGALQLVLAALVDPGDGVLLSDPGYPCNRHLIRLAGGEAIALPVGLEEGFQPTASQVEAALGPRARVLLVASPANPTGTLIGPARLGSLLEAVRRHRGALVADEIYQGLVYGDSPGTALALGGDDVLVVNSFSKFFGMTGWRVGWVVAPHDLVPVLDRLAQNLFLAAPTVSQHAALAAFAPETLAILEQRRQVFRERRNYLAGALSALGFEVAARPDGAFYLYADCTRFTEDSFALSEALLEEAGVAVTPGRDFGRHGAQRYLRFAYTTSLDRLREGMMRIAGFLGGAGA
jgi:aspartate/methionine/tyrosine aminotransferase